MIDIITANERRFWEAAKIAAKVNQSKSNYLFFETFNDLLSRATMAANLERWNENND